MRCGVILVILLSAGCRPPTPPPQPASKLTPLDGQSRDWLTAQDALAALRVLERRGGAPESLRFTVSKRGSDLGGVVLQLADPGEPGRFVLVDVGPDRQAALGSVDVFRGDTGAYRLATCLEDLARRTKDPLALLEVRPTGRVIGVLAVAFPAMPGSHRTYTYDSLGKLLGETTGE